jgi:DNA mismatch repair protein MutS2
MSKTARDLGFDEVLERIAHFAYTTETHARLLQTRPFEHQADAEREHTWVREALALTDLGESLPIRQTQTLGSIIEGLQGGTIASGLDLHHCRVCLEQALLLNQHTTRQMSTCPTLAQAFVLHGNLDDLVASLQTAIDEGGQILDRASNALRAARRELGSARELLRQEQNALVQRYKAQLSGTYFAEREGRFVLPLRIDAERIDGTILGSSASGNTLYVEPRELTKHNNRLRLAEARVHQEELAVLQELSNGLRLQLDAVRQAAENCVLGDRIAAIATWAKRVAACPTTFASEPVLRVQAMRHPLLVGTNDSQSTAVANDLELYPGRALILSGPNAGGKTVALKCLGLAVWLSKSGLPVPCGEESEIGWFSEVLTDIGDDQSIARSLSTFSSHIVHLSHCIDTARHGVLILLDEVAGGTDPDEGAALAEAVLRALVEAGASIAVTTHYPRLKQLAALDESQFCNGSVGFDLDTMQPTFRVTLGIPGVSSALAVASRFGIPAKLVAVAQGLLPKEHHAQQRLLQRISVELDKTTANRNESDAVLQEAQRKAVALGAEHQRTLQTDRMALEKLRDQLIQEVKQARSDLLRAKNLLAFPSKENYRDAELLVNQAALPITVDGSLTRALRATTHAPPTSVEAFTPGMSVHITHLGTDAQVLEAPHKGQLRVSIGGLKLSVALTQVQKAKQPAPMVANRPSKSKRGPEPGSAIDVSSALRSSRNTCDLRGKRVDEGLNEVDSFLDKMLQLHETAAFLLHGHGTGAMRAAVREHLVTSPLVRHFEAASTDAGGEAFTVVWLK